MLNAQLPWKSARLSDRKYVAYCNHDDTRNANEQGFATISQYLAPESHNLVRKILEPKPQERASINEFFEDTWFNNLGVCDDSTCGLDHTTLAKGV